ncbi:MAG: division/cell wall cluster transcriptional repressor MraZ [Deltaproteobacteria bacterium]|nr:MAG: division/cell wall cluster transcriptional repressor MraZ [Deltaproteobacteria bacterium]
MLRVRCQANATLDAKGRLMLPAPLKRAVGVHGVTQLVLTFQKGAVYGWSPDEFEKIESKVEGLDPFDDEVADFVHAFLSTANDVDIDGQGRIRVPPMLRELAGLDKDVVVNSMLNRIEIWDRETWEGRFKESLGRRAVASGLPGRKGEG